MDIDTLDDIEIRADLDEQAAYEEYAQGLEEWMDEHLSDDMDVLEHFTVEDSKRLQAYDFEIMHFDRVDRHGWVKNCGEDDEVSLWWRDGKYWIERPNGDREAFDSVEKGLWALFVQPPGSGPEEELW